MSQREQRKKIDQLINTKQAENNYLALSLMQTQLGMSFEEAFSELKMTLVEVASLFNSDRYLLRILDFYIYFEIDHCWATVKEYPFLEINRTVVQKKTCISKYSKCFTIDFFESENDRDMFEAMSSLPNLGEGLKDFFFPELAND